MEGERHCLPRLSLLLIHNIRPGSENQLTTSEQLQLDSEMDGTVDAEEKEEQKRQKDEKWARFADANPRGAGNTMNRG